MTDDEKRRFFELAQKDAERYQAEVAAYGGEDALRKRKRAKKDPNAPKRALLVALPSPLFLTEASIVADRHSSSSHTTDARTCNRVIRSGKSVR